MEPNDKYCFHNVIMMEMGTWLGKRRKELGNCLSTELLLVSYD